MSAADLAPSFKRSAMPSSAATASAWVTILPAVRFIRTMVPEACFARAGLGFAISSSPRLRSKRATATRNSLRTRLSWSEHPSWGPARGRSPTSSKPLGGGDGHSHDRPGIIDLADGQARLFANHDPTAWHGAVLFEMKRVPL